MTTATKFAPAPITKAVTDGSGRFTAILAAFGPPADWQNEIFDRGAFQQSILDWLARGVRVPVFWNHEADKPNSKIGDVLTMREVDAGLLIEGQLNLKNPLAVEVYEALLTGSLDSMSIGYRYGDSYSADDGRHIATADVVEATFTPTPAEPRARVLSVKRRSATKAEVGRKIMAQLDDQFHQFASWEPELWKKLARRIKSCVDDPRCDVQDLRDSVAAFIQSERARVRWAREDRKLDDALLRGKLDDLIASTHVGAKSPPWHVEERDGQYCVILDEDGSTVKCHPTREAADAHLRALYANVPEDEKSVEDQLTVVASIGRYRILRSGRGFVIVTDDDTPIGRRRTLSEAREYVAGLVRDDDLRAQVNALLGPQGKSAKSAPQPTDEVDQLVREVRVQAAKERADREAFEAAQDSLLHGPIDWNQLDQQERERQQRDLAEIDRRAAERAADRERAEQADAIARTREWVPAGAAAAYWETVGATPAPEAPMTYPEPRVHDAVPDDVGQTIRAPITMVGNEGVTIASEPAPLAAAPDPGGEVVRLQVGGEVVPEVRVAQPAEDAFRIPTVVPEISRTIEQEQRIPSVDGVTDAEPIDVGLTVRPPKARRPKRKEVKS